MEAARAAALRGHQVRLIERQSQLGGRLLLAARPPGREEWTQLLAHKTHALETLGVTVSLQTTVDARLLAQMRPDFVVLATGARFPLPSLPGAASAPLLTVDEAVADPQRVGNRVLIVDYLDRQPALAAAIMFAEQGRAVDIATSSLHVGMKLEIQNLTYFYRRAIQGGVRFLPCATATAFERDGHVMAENPFTRQISRLGPYDSIVLASAGVPQQAAAADLDARGLPWRAIGDAYAPRDVEAAILEGFELGVAL